MAAGQNSVFWDGTDKNGNRMPDGNYTFEIMAADINGKDIDATTFFTGTVEKVTFENNASFLISGSQKIALGDVVEVAVPENAAAGDHLRIRFDRSGTTVVNPFNQWRKLKMIGSLFAGISGLNANSTAMTVIGDNIANVNTTAFKANRSMFANVLSQSLGGSHRAAVSAGASNFGVPVRCGPRDRWKTQATPPIWPSTARVFYGAG